MLGDKMPSPEGSPAPADLDGNPDQHRPHLGDVAQLEERRSGRAEVTGSSPVFSTLGSDWSSRARLAAGWVGQDMARLGPVGSGMDTRQESGRTVTAPRC